MQNKENSLIELLRDIDWYLAVLWDNTAAFIARDYAATKKDCGQAAAFVSALATRFLAIRVNIPRLNLPSLPAWSPERVYALARVQQKRISHHRKLSALIFLLCFSWIVSMTPTENPAVTANATPPAPAQPLMEQIKVGLQSFAGALSPISTADAALPKSDESDAAFDSSTVTGLADNPAAAQIAEETKPASKTIKLGKGETLSAALASIGIEKKEAHSLFAALRRVYSPKKLDRSDEIDIEFGPSKIIDGKKFLTVETLSFSPSHDQRIVVSKQANDKFKAKSEQRSVDVRLSVINTTISGSLSASAKKAGIPQSVLSEMIRAFSYDVDFQRDVHSGDKLEVAFEEIWDDEGKFAKNGNFLYGSLKIGKRDVQIYRYQSSEDSRADYYDGNGRSIRKALLRTPVDGARITNGFGMRRHPILGYSKMHEGVDFGAPTGTPIVAAGDGIVKKKGWNGGYGHYIEIQHNKEFSSAYGHLSRYSGTLKVGQRVRQGDVIGYVGSTGLSTGPHLHYEVHRSHRKVNPLGIKFSTGTQLAGKELQKFKVAVASIQQKVSAAKDSKKNPKIAMR